MKDLLLAVCVGLQLCALADGWDASLKDYPRRAGETDDTARIQRAIDANADGTLYFPRGVYLVSSPVRANNFCSLSFNRRAVLRATKPMDYVLHMDVRDHRWALQKKGPLEDYALFASGGTIDGNGLAGCMFLNSFIHFTLRDMTFLNGKTCGLRVTGGYELMAQNLYFKCEKPGLAGNTALYTSCGDSHYVDCVSVDYTVGFRTERPGSCNRFTRCHAWGGPLPPVRPGEDCEMLKDSICFWVDGAGGIIFRDCYADTGKTGFLIDGGNTLMSGCYYYNPYSRFKLDDTTIIDHRQGLLRVTDSHFGKESPKCRAYVGIGTVEWSNVEYTGFEDADELPGACRFVPPQAATAPDEWDLLPGGRPFAFTSEPGEFLRKPDYRDAIFLAFGKEFAKRFPSAGPGRALIVRARATAPDTKFVELSLKEPGKPVWKTNVPLTAEDRTIRIPFPKTGAPDARRLTGFTVCYGKWLCPDTADKAHGFVIDSVRIEQ